MAIPPNKLAALLAQLRSGAVPPADATAVARNKGTSPATPEEAEARPREADFRQHRDSLYEKFGTGAASHQDPMYSAANIAGDRAGMFEPISGASNTPYGHQVDSAYTDVGIRAEDAAHSRRAANLEFAKMLMAAAAQSGQRKVR